MCERFYLEYQNGSYGQWTRDSQNSFYNTFEDAEKARSSRAQSPDPSYSWRLWRIVKTVEEVVDIYPEHFADLVGDAAGLTLLGQ